MVVDFVWVVERKTNRGLAAPKAPEGTVVGTTSKTHVLGMSCRTRKGPKWVLRFIRWLPADVDKRVMSAGARLVMAAIEGAFTADHVLLIIFLLRYKCTKHSHGVPS